MQNNPQTAREGLRAKVEVAIWFFEDDYAAGESESKDKSVAETVDKIMAAIDQYVSDEVRQAIRNFNIEDYHSMKAPGLDCPVCQVDTGDSYHFKDCWIGKALGENLR